MKAGAEQVLILAIDVGGTFTDVVGLDADGQLRVEKILTTPDDQAAGAVTGARTLAGSLEGVTTIVHGTTVATNAILERKGARTAVVTTWGFRDVLEFQTQERTDIWDLFYRKPEPLVPRDLRFEVRERMAADGRVVHPLDPASLARVLRALRRARPQSVVVAFLNSYRNPAHERAARAAIADALPGVYVSASADVLPRFREYDRFSTAVLNGYVAPVVQGYLQSFAHLFRAAGFRGEVLLMQSNGGVLPARAAAELAVWTCLSGPAGGVLGAVALGRLLGESHLITFDMGGTSTDVCLITGGRPEVAMRSSLNGYPVALPMFNILTIGAGGGSLAWVDPGGFLQVGPQSAGAHPGPACYGRGGEHPTVTDANCALGILRPGRLLGGHLSLDGDAARRSLRPIAQRLDLPVEETAEAVRRIADARMAQAVRLVSVDQGYDPRRYTMMAFGGAGPLHAAAVAEDVGIRRVVIPAFPGAFSAYGLLCADFLREYERTVLAGDSLTSDGLRRILQDLARQAQDDFAQWGVDGRPEVAFALDMRYEGQAYELPILVDPDRLEDAVQRFHHAHQTRFGFAESESRVEVVNARVQARVRRHPPRLQADLAHDRPPEAEGVVRHQRPLTCRFLPRAAVPTTGSLEGPVVVEERTATTWVPPGWGARRLEGGHLLLERRT
ncbi:MAG: hydantoinase/oxoprolinase family protein [Armatimonadota bacterium]|nr:hydantoinase/oxoprolinase family protein [Armatimonadota bacterium]MDR7449511.1 hydantoinase/oxoprolinase family protein [Armatimonadota bacterium]MDR7479721.1 hydantoinase/oxoprolinase family protein [Armatimonadota bacterium]MDR7489122.1 hydantoinase/oxoprolinase family protein [Armatimonadota bacterium]MDR7501736.1 hydantoinase/oxoprolinase family protein [Armatimonadota bacterium]